MERPVVKCKPAFSTESFAFRLSVVVVTGIVAGVSIYQANAWNRVRRTNPTDPLKKESNDLFWLNLIIAIISLVLFIWSVYRLVYSSRAREAHKEKVYRKYLYNTEIGVGTPTVVTTPKVASPSPK